MAKTKAIIASASARPESQFVRGFDAEGLFSTAMCITSLYHIFDVETASSSG
jgi:hypothetical protein